MIHLRPATPEDAPLMVDLVDMAGDGLPMAAWRGVLAADGVGGDARAFGIRHALRDRGGFTWRNAVIAEWDGVAAGMLMCWPLPLEPRPLEDLPPLVQPIQGLENLARGRLLVNAVAVLPSHRRKGIGWMLVQTVTDRAALIVGDGNTPARAMYERLGFVEIAREAAVGDDLWTPPHRHWCLMVRG
ncbi:MAG: GNAT family N-acetyltransferase [Rhodobacteraceae bacterium PARR1]|nr:MAG: GNAT family N-acetyltransferase [Rhodobacteraceae bacterium PARR1]